MLVIRLLALFTLFPFVMAQAAEFELAIQPVLPKAQLERAYQPLADYLSKQTGHAIRIRASYNFLGYWEAMRRGKGFDLVLDAAHFTDFRDRNMGYTVLAKLPDTVSYSLVTHEDLFIFEPGELVAKKLATVSSPSLGGVRLAELFPNPLRQPRIIGTNNYAEALDLVHQRKADAALAPTPLIWGDDSLNVVTTTEPVPHMALSASPRVDKPTRQAIRQALLQANKTPTGKAMLKKLNLPGFETASNATYRGYARLLEGVWGY
jgi:phosphonate transport system substrate-binding protein